MSSPLFNPSNTCVTIGTFDGVHLGHRSVINTLTRVAAEKGIPSRVITFDVPPKKVLDPGNNNLKVLTSLNEKVAMIRSLGVDFVDIIPFTHEFSTIPPEKFVKEYLVERYHAMIIVMGYDHFFGKGANGDFMLLNSLASKLGFEVIRVEQLHPERHQEMNISSSSIRECLTKGQMEEAAGMLGYHYQLSGIVVKGQQLGRTLGFPTANILPDDPMKLIPMGGVYAVKAHVDHREYYGMCNIGNRPTINGSNLSIETNIFGFDADIYGQSLALSFVHRIRDEKKFNGLEELKARLSEDHRIVTDYFASGFKTKSRFHCL